MKYYTTVHHWDPESECIVRHAHFACCEATHKRSVQHKAHTEKRSVRRRFCNVIQYHQRWTVLYSTVSLPSTAYELCVRRNSQRCRGILRMQSWRCRFTREYIASLPLGTKKACIANSTVQYCITEFRKPRDLNAVGSARRGYPCRPLTRSVIRCHHLTLKVGASMHVRRGQPLFGARNTKCGGVRQRLVRVRVPIPFSQASLVRPQTVAQ